jgi:hypothetical protein
MIKAFPKWIELINESFLSQEFKVEYKAIIEERLERLN